MPGYGVALAALLVCFVLAGPLPAAGNGLQDDLFSVTFPTEDQGWACGRWGTVVHTADGGKTWQRQQPGTDFTLSSIFFVDERSGWAVGDEGTIVHTADGGTTWMTQSSPVPTTLMGVFFVSPSRGWIVTERTTILATEDGGTTWEVVFTDEDFILKAVAFADPAHGWAVGEYGFIYHTTDGGRTWEWQAGEFGFSEATGEIVGGNYLFGVAAVSPLEAWVVGIDGYAARTVDGGATWERIAGLPRTHLFGVAARGDEVLVAGRALLLSSQDRGLHWDEVPTEPPITYGWLYRVAMRDASPVAVGRGGWIYRAEGDVWTRVEGR